MCGVNLGSSLATFEAPLLTKEANGKKVVGMKKWKPYKVGKLNLYVCLPCNKTLRFIITLKTTVLYELKKG